ncbi:hypothetical protein PR048_020811 [Dryococelus australis]|uniref:Uncharacterized protein n=1 Tax=Dryococelus australis TaxID=614101 RepID=A0ABQ9GWI6_9NEOP|nr:hypothetical protein PR048_020811 [Dryococelus australis]
MILACTVSPKNSKKLSRQHPFHKTVLSAEQQLPPTRPSQFQVEHVGTICAKTSYRNNWHFCYTSVHIYSGLGGSFVSRVLWLRPSLLRFGSSGDTPVISQAVQQQGCLASVQVVSAVGLGAGSCMLAGWLLDSFFFQKDLPAKAEVDPDNLMNLAYSVKINPKRMKKLEKDYTVMKTKEQEEMVELRCQKYGCLEAGCLICGFPQQRLRTENRLLRQRVELLEAESSELADRLVRGQVSRAEEEETSFVVQRELAALRHTHLETSHQLELAHEEIRNLSLLMEETHNSRQSSLEEISMKRELLGQKEELIECLQEELVKVRLREAENDALIRDLRARIQELEEVSGSTDTATGALVAEQLDCLPPTKANWVQSPTGSLLNFYKWKSCWTMPLDKKTLRETTPDNSVAHLQEELIAVKLREAEANLSLKDLRQRVGELSAQWQRHLQRSEVYLSLQHSDGVDSILLSTACKGVAIRTPAPRSPHPVIEAFLRGEEPPLGIVNSWFGSSMICSPAAPSSNPQAKNTSLSTSNQGDPQPSLRQVKCRQPASSPLPLKNDKRSGMEIGTVVLVCVQEHRTEATPPPDSTPKKLLFWESRGNETQRLEEDLMTTRIREMETLTEVKELRLKVMELETQQMCSSVSRSKKCTSLVLWKLPKYYSLAVCIGSGITTITLVLSDETRALDSYSIKLKRLRVKIRPGGIQQMRHLFKHTHTHTCNLYPDVPEGCTSMWQHVAHDSNA